MYAFFVGGGLKTGRGPSSMVVNGCRYREPLGTTDKREAPRLERERIAQLQNRAPDPTKRSKSYSSMDIAVAVEAYIVERRAQVSPRMVAYWREEARPLAGYFKNLKLKSITPAHIAAYQNVRLDAGRAPKTINGEVSVLRPHRASDDEDLLTRQALGTGSSSRRVAATKASTNRGADGALKPCYVTFHVTKH